MARLSGAASRLIKSHKSKTSGKLIKILKERYTHQPTPDVVLSQFLNFKQSPTMTVQEFLGKAFDMSLRALVIDSLQGEVVEKSRTVVLDSMLLGNLSPEIRKGCYSKKPKIPRRNSGNSTSGRKGAQECQSLLQPLCKLLTEPPKFTLCCGL